MEALSAVAAFSKFHFHRQFSELFGWASTGTSSCPLEARLVPARVPETAIRIIDIALASGYESHEAFSRAFKKTVGQTPSEFREQPRWDPWRATYQPVSEVRSLHMKPDNRSENVQIVDFKATRVGALEHRGDPGAAGEHDSHVHQLAAGEPPAPPGERHLQPVLRKSGDAARGVSPGPCAATERPIGDNPFGVANGRFPAVAARSCGTSAPTTRWDTIKYLYCTWLPASGEEPRDFPLYAQRVSMFPDVPEHEAITDVFLPLR